MKKIAIIGAGDLGQLIAYHFINDSAGQVVGFYDDFLKEATYVNGIKVLGKLNRIQRDYESNLFKELIIGIGYKHLSFREEIFKLLCEKVPFATFIHSSCYVDPSCKIGKGTCLLPGSTLGRNVELKSNVLVNIGCVIAHDSVIDEHTFLSPSVAIAGFVSIGKKCNLGINATIIDNLSISNDIQIGGGTVVISSLTKKGLYVGSPARFIR